jgi:hypothetical protein
LSGSEFHKTGAAYLNELLPYLDDFTCGICNRFFCSETNTKKIEKIQERALRFVYQDYEASYENLLIKAKMPTQQIRRI